MGALVMTCAIALYKKVYCVLENCNVLHIKKPFYSKLLM